VPATYNAAGAGPTKRAMNQAPSTAITAAPSGGSARILVIDDSSLIRQAAEIALGRVAGFSVTTAPDAEAGIALAQQTQPDAIVLDLVMPGVDGVECAARLAASDAVREIPIVMLTAADAPEDRARLDAIGAAGVITKPFSVATLGDQLTTLLGWPR